MSGTRGFALILSAPSGAGKTTLARRLSAMPGLTDSISTTTRPPRPREVEGKDYFFVSVEEFKERAQAGAFLEWAEVFGKYYGTGAAFVEAILARGEVAILDIDWQGARQVRERLPAHEVVSVFILPPKREELERRLSGRGQDDAEVIAARMEKAAREASHWQEYQYVIINDDLDRAFAELTAIVQAEGLRRERVGQSVAEVLDSFAIPV